jgi:hypothetical protein
LARHPYRVKKFAVKLGGTGENQMPKKPCAICGAEYNEGHLLFHDKGPICVACEAELEEAKEVHNGAYSAIAAGPLISFAASAFMLGAIFPGIGQLVMVVTPFLALFAIFAGGRAIRHAYFANEAQGFTRAQRTMLYVSGVVSILWSGPLLVVGCGSVLMSLYQLWISSS